MTGDLDDDQADELVEVESAGQEWADDHDGEPVDLTGLLDR